MKEIRLLLLDSGSWFNIVTIYLKEYQITVEVVTLKEPNNRYVVSGSEISAIQEITAREKFDVIIIGNNMGAGVDRVNTLDSSLLGQTIVVWSSSRPGAILDNYDYYFRTKGITSFGFRDQPKDVADMIYKMTNKE